MDIQSILDKTLPGLGYEVVDFELTTQGDLRVFIDKEAGITIDDCADVSNHLTRVFAVEDVDYRRLEISSPGLDRPLKKFEDFERFSGSPAKIKMRLPVNGQKQFAGRLGGTENGNIVLYPEMPEKKTGRRGVPAIADEPVLLAFDNIDKARLKPEF